MTVESDAQKVNAPRGDNWMLHRQLLEHAAGMRASAVGNLFNATATVAAFSQSTPTWILAFGYILLIGLISWRYFIAKAIRTANPYSPKLRNMKRSVIANAISLGAFWGGTAGFFLGTASSDLHLVAIAIGSGMMCIGPISYRTIEKAALGYLFAAVPGCCAGLILIGNVPAFSVGGFLLCFVIVLTVNIKISARSFIESNDRERALEKSGDTIQLLLNDYAEQGSDWLIEMAEGGRIVNPCARLAQATGRPIEALHGKVLTTLVDPCPQAETLHDHIISGRAFRQHIVSLTIDGEQKWWSISAKPTREAGIWFRGVVTDITAQRRAEERVSYMAHFDGLTDLPNRFSFCDELYHTLNRNKGVAGLMYLDLDGFKGVNDTLGHPVGDQLLQAVARRIEGCLSKHETVGRMGGDEFAVMVRINRLPYIHTLARQIVVALSTPFPIAGHQIQIGVSIGIARAPEHETTVDGLFRKADLALYTAKASGRNCAVLFEPGMDHAAEERRQLETDLRHALAENELRLHYQPIVNAQTGNTVAYEALVRWEHPTRGTIMPTTFICVAEENGMIVQLGDWVIRQALDDLARWPQDIGVSINLSPAQMRSPNLVANIVNALASTAVDANRVCLEITETVLLQDSESNIEILHKLRALGLRIALDDFGTGYSSLNYLRSFPFDTIKIDRCFVQDIQYRADCQAIVRSVVSLANSLGMSIVAEGVESVEQVEQLILEGCNTVQGFLYSKAVPIEELTDLRGGAATLDQKLVRLEQERRKSESALLINKGMRKSA
jgi:diguanylate cyclase (GGDEF)-like protein